MMQKVYFLKKLYYNIIFLKNIPFASCKNNFLKLLISNYKIFYKNVINL